jgi:hypoxanthine-DNA glycosylase
MKKAFEPIVTPSSKILILGTMPGEKSLELQQYYGNRGNQFWKLMFEVFDESFSHDYQQRIDLIVRHDIAMWDVLQYCEREGSLDSSIKNEIANDFNAFYKMYPKIRHVFFTSKNAAKFYDKYVRRKEGLVYETLSSPSGANATKSYAEKLADWKGKILPQI